MEYVKTNRMCGIMWTYEQFVDEVWMNHIKNLHVEKWSKKRDHSVCVEKSLMSKRLECLCKQYDLWFGPNIQSQLLKIFPIQPNKNKKTLYTLTPLDVSKFDKIDLLIVSKFGTSQEQVLSVLQKIDGEIQNGSATALEKLLTSNDNTPQPDKYPTMLVIGFCCVSPFFGLTQMQKNIINKPHIRKLLAMLTTTLIQETSCKTVIFDGFAGSDICNEIPKQVKTLSQQDLNKICVKGACITNIPNLYQSFKDNALYTNCVCKNFKIPQQQDNPRIGYRKLPSFFGIIIYGLIVYNAKPSNFTTTQNSKKRDSAMLKCIVELSVVYKKGVPTGLEMLQHNYTNVIQNMFQTKQIFSTPNIKRLTKNGSVDIGSDKSINNTIKTTPLTINKRKRDIFETKSLDSTDTISQSGGSDLTTKVPKINAKRPTKKNKNENVGQHTITKYFNATKNTSLEKKMSDLKN